MSSRFCAAALPTWPRSTSTRSTSTPLSAACWAICEPMVPAPRTMRRPVASDNREQPGDPVEGVEVVHAADAQPPVEHRLEHGAAGGVDIHGKPYGSDVDQA